MQMPDKQAKKAEHHSKSGAAHAKTRKSGLDSLSLSLTLDIPSGSRARKDGEDKAGAGGAPTST